VPLEPYRGHYHLSDREPGGFTGVFPSMGGHCCPVERIFMQVAVQPLADLAQTYRDIRA